MSDSGTQTGSGREGDAGTDHEKNRSGFGLLPRDRTFAGLLPAFILPYAAYAGLRALPSPLGAEVTDVLRFALIGALLWFFRRSYRFGARLTPPLAWLCIPAAVFATGLWVAGYRFSLSLPGLGPVESAKAAGPSLIYWLARTANSVLWVPIFEELFCRVYLTELFYGAGRDAAKAEGHTGNGVERFLSALSRRPEMHPEKLAALPLNAVGIVGPLAFFTLGHPFAAWIPAVLYYAFTTWLYAKTKSLRTCMAVHALTNLAIALLVAGRPAMQYLWY